MKTYLRLNWPALAFAACLTLALVARAQEPATTKTDATSAPAAATPSSSTTVSNSVQPDTAPSAAPAATAPTAPSAAAAPQSDEKGGATVAPAASASTSTVTAASTTETASTVTDAKTTEEPALRRLDQPNATEAEKATPEAKPARRSRGHRGSSENGRVGFGQNMHLGPDESAEAVVSIFGSSTSEGTVDGAVVSVAGDTHVTGPVNDAAVAVLGSVYVNNHVGDSVVAVLGDVELGPKADVGEVVCVGGTIKRDPQAVVHGNTQTVSIGGPWGSGSHMVGLRTWFTKCLMLGRPLAFGNNLGWAWTIAGAFLVFYTLVALLFGRGVDRCVQTLVTRPGFSILAALLTILLVPIATVLLALTGIGIAVIPFIVIALIGAAIFGKVVMFAAVGRPITKLFGEGPAAHAAVAVLIGGAIVLVLYTIPFFGFLLMKLLGWIGLGVVVYTLILVSRREKPAVAVAGTVPPVVGATGVGFTAGGIGVETAAAGVAVETPIPVSALPRAGFWIRMGALLLDVILCGILMALMNSVLPHRAEFGMPGGLIIILAVYGAVMWKLKGTSIGGIVCGLRVVRTDNRPIDWATAVVRALGCFLSLVVVGLGFIWIAIDDEKQSWHDKIAGTAVVLSRGTTLV